MVARWGTAGAQLWVDRYGTWFVCGTGKAWHAGNVLPGMPSNIDSWGIETDHTVNEEWPQALVDSLRIGTIAILKWMGQNTAALHFHKSICSPRGRKIDPAGMDLGTERSILGSLWNGGPAVPRPAPAPATKYGPYYTGPLGSRTVDVYDRGDDVKFIQAKVGAVVDGYFGPGDTEDKVVAYQRSVGLTADGVVGPLTWSKMLYVAPAKPVRDDRQARATQAAVHTPVDGMWGDQTDRAVYLVYCAAVLGTFPDGVQATQRAVGTKDDGAWGPNSKRALDETVAELQRAWGTTADGDWGPKTSSAHQAARSRNYKAW